MDAKPLIFFLSYEKGGYSMVLKLSGAVHLSHAKMLVC